MLNDCYRYIAAFNLKAEPFPSKPLLIALLLSQYKKMIDWLTSMVSKYKLIDKEVKEYKREEEKRGIS